MRNFPARRRLEDTQQREALASWLQKFGVWILGGFFAVGFPLYTIGDPYILGVEVPSFVFDMPLVLFGVLVFLVGYIATQARDGALALDRLFPRAQEVFMAGVFLALPGIIPLFFYADYLAWGWLGFWLLLGFWWAARKAQYLWDQWINALIVGVGLGLVLYAFSSPYLASLELLGFAGLVLITYFLPRDRTNRKVWGLVIGFAGLLVQVNFYLWVMSLLVVGTLPYWRPPKNRHKVDHLLPSLLFPAIFGAFLSYWYQGWLSFGDELFVLQRFYWSDPVNLFFGVGPGQYVIAGLRDSATLLSPDGVIMPGSSAILFLHEYGLIGMLIVLGLLWSLLMTKKGVYGFVALCFFLFSPEVLATSYGVAFFFVLISWLFVRPEGKAFTQKNRVR